MVLYLIIAGFIILSFVALLLVCGMIKWLYEVSPALGVIGFLVLLYFLRTH